VEFASKHFSLSLGDDQQVILFQIVRELLINVGKHSQATQAKVILSLQKPYIKIQVNDNGVGFDTAQVFNPKSHNRGFGFFSVRERLNYIGGELEIKSKTGQGSQIILKVPRRKNSKSRKEAHA
jgi:signal transduction histidine kinase